MSDLGLGLRNLRHGHAKRGAKSPEYRAWRQMIRRCHDPRARAYAYYGASSVAVCTEWREDFSAFLAHVGLKPSPTHTLDRINGGNYEPGNVRWATHTEQMRNTRANRLLVHGGETRCLAEWAEVVGLPRDTIKARLTYSWSVARALTTPVDTRFHHKETTT